MFSSLYILSAFYNPYRHLFSDFVKVLAKSLLPKELRRRYPARLAVSPYPITVYNHFCKLHDFTRLPLTRTAAQPPGLGKTKRRQVGPCVRGAYTCRRKGLSVSDSSFLVEFGVQLHPLECCVGLINLSSGHPTVDRRITGVSPGGPSSALWTFHSAHVPPVVVFVVPFDCDHFPTRANGCRVGVPFLGFLPRLGDDFIVRAGDFLAGVGLDDGGLDCRGVVACFFVSHVLPFQGSCCC